MTYVVTEPCIDVKDKACMTACPVDCIYEGGRTVYIHPDECIDCGLCETICPVAAIYPDDRLPGDRQPWLAVNAAFFGPAVTGWGSPGGSDERHRSPLDHPTVREWPVQRPPG